MRNFLGEISNKVLVYDGSKGYMLQKLGLKGGECGELWNITKQQTVKEIFMSYIDAGADVIQTNTFTGSRIHLRKYSLEDKTYDINYWGAKLAREAAGEDKFVCASIGPAGVLFEPSGELTFNQAYDLYCEQTKAVMDGGADAINFETFTDLAELRAALLAAKDTTNLPVICSLAFENNGRTLMGTDPVVAAIVLKALGADMVGANCSFGPEHMLDIIKAMHKAGGGYICVKPNAGLPQMVDGRAVYKDEPAHFAKLASHSVQYAARLIGGCCGTTPEFIKELRKRLEGIEPVAPNERSRTVITSSTKKADTKNLNCENVGILDFEKDDSLRGILQSGDFTELDDIAIDISAEGNDAVYVSLESKDDQLLAKVIDRVQWYVKAPLIIETESPEALNRALRIYRGVAGVAIKKCQTETMEEIKAVADKYGSVVFMFN
jgi:5-methyltetrahydrofolate--homocysteine methyltransferase